jgi:hypothetical protein
MDDPTPRTQPGPCSQARPHDFIRDGEGNSGPADVACRPAMAIQTGVIHVVDEETWQMLERLCDEIIDTSGMVEAFLEMALTMEGEERTRILKAAKNLSLRGTKSVKKFLWQWAGLREQAQDPFLSSTGETNRKTLLPDKKFATTDSFGAYPQEVL